MQKDRITQPITIDEITSAVVNFLTPNIRSILKLPPGAERDSVKFNGRKLICETVIKHFFSQGFIKKFFYDKTDFSNPSDVNKMLCRLEYLAECLYNLQNSKGFLSHLNKWKESIEKASNAKDADIKFESYLTELLAARYLFLVNLPVEFLKETGDKKSDYDIKTTLPDGQDVAVEAKCKTNESNVSFPNFLDTIRKGYSQLPNNVKKIIFVKVPASWANDKNFEEIQLLGIGEESILFHYQSSFGILWEVEPSSDYWTIGMQYFDGIYERDDIEKAVSDPEKFFKNHPMMRYAQGMNNENNPNYLDTAKLFEIGFKIAAIGYR